MKTSLSLSDFLLDRRSLLIEIKFRMDIAGVNRLVTYSLRVTECKGGVTVERENSPHPAQQGRLPEK